MPIIPATVVIIIVISFIVCCCPPFRLTIHSRLSSIIRHVPVIHHHASDQVYHNHSFLSACSLLVYHMSQNRSWRTPCSATRCHRNTSYTLRYQSDGRHLQICDDLWFCFGMNIIHLYVVSHKYFYVYIYIHMFFIYACIHRYQTLLSTIKAFQNIIYNFRCYLENLTICTVNIYVYRICSACDSTWPFCSPNWRSLNLASLHRPKKGYPESPGIDKFS